MESLDCEQTINLHIVEKGQQELFIARLGLRVGRSHARCWEVMFECLSHVGYGFRRFLPFFQVANMNKQQKKQMDLNVKGPLKEDSKRESYRGRKKQGV